MKVALWAEIHRLHEGERLSTRALARRLHVSRKTVRQALALPTPPVAVVAVRSSILDPFKPEITRWIEQYPDLSAVRVLEEIQKSGYAGEITLVRNFLREIRPARGRVYQEVEHAPGRAMQIDWGSCGVVGVGAWRRKVSVFVAVLCYSRLLYIEFTLSQKKAHFYRCFKNALHFFDGVTERVILDNLSTAVAEGGMSISHAPRPCVPATSFRSESWISRSTTTVFGKPSSNGTQFVPPLLLYQTPTSVPMYQSDVLLGSTAIAFTGWVRKSPVTSDQEAPRSVVSAT